MRGRTRTVATGRPGHLCAGPGGREAARPGRPPPPVPCRVATCSRGVRTRSLSLPCETRVGTQRPSASREEATLRKERPRGAGSDPEAGQPPGRRGGLACGRQRALLDWSAGPAARAQIFQQQVRETRRERRPAGARARPRAGDPAEGSEGTPAEGRWGRQRGLGRGLPCQVSDC